MLLASSRGEHARAIGRQLGCSDETVRGVIWAFEERGLEVLKAKSRRPKEVHAAFSPTQAEQLKDLLHHSPREYGKATSLWTLELAAEVCHEKGITDQRFSDETVRATLERLGVHWKRAKEWITSTDAQYERKKTNATD
jgi:transposase